jgi:hypothetical protein
MNVEQSESSIDLKTNQILKEIQKSNLSIDDYVSTGVAIENEMMAWLSRVKCVPKENQDEKNQDQDIKINKSSEIKIMCWNVHGLNVPGTKNWKKMVELTELCNSEMADILVLVEVVARPHTDAEEENIQIQNVLLWIFNSREVCQCNTWKASFVSQPRTTYAGTGAKESHIILYRNVEFVEKDKNPLSQLKDDIDNVLDFQVTQTKIACSTLTNPPTCTLDTFSSVGIQYPFRCLQDTYTKRSILPLGVALRFLKS